MNGVRLVEDLRQWGCLWSVRLELAHEGPVDAVPEWTEWYFCCEDVYPLGSVRVFPAKERSLDVTFPHQLHNQRSPGDELPWREGKLCLESDVAVFRRWALTPEPWTEDGRLVWYAQRAIRWLKCAAEGTLRREGDPFELPDFSASVSSSVVFCEEPYDLEGWSDGSHEAGYAELVELPTGKGRVFAVKAFRSPHGEVIRQVDWGAFVREEGKQAPRAIWIRLKRVPVLEPWQAPMTWNELNGCVQGDDLDLGATLKKLVPALRVEKGRARSLHFLLLGFPLPEKVGGAPVRIHWLALTLPPLARKDQFRNGFRKGKAGAWALDSPKVKGSKKVAWIRSECWSPRELGGRGRFSEVLCDSKFLLIGAGALGSAVAELLARGGVRNFTIMDHDVLAAGNLVRHTLDLQHLGAKKAESLAKRLNRAAPLAEVRAIARKFSAGPCLDGCSGKDLEAVHEAEVVVDLTGSDEVLHHLARFPWKGRRLFASLSLGWRASRLYAFMAWGRTFPLARYCDQINPWIEKDLAEIDGEEAPREGLGCWHPVFPARLDHIWGMTAPALDLLEEAVRRELSEPVAAVFERAAQPSDQWGLKRVA